jgi:hypothetical protein
MESIGKLRRRPTFYENTATIRKDLPAPPPSVLTTGRPNKRFDIDRPTAHPKLMANRDIGLTEEIAQRSTRAIGKKVTSWARLL